MTQSNDLSQRVDRTEGQIVDLQLAANLILQTIEKNSADIAALIEVSRHTVEVSRRNSDAIVALQASQLRTDEAIQGINASIQGINTSIQGINASIERMDRLFDYLIRRDQRQSEE